MTSQRDQHRTIAVSLQVVNKDTELFVELDNYLTLGRSYPQTSAFSGIDLTAFDAYTLDVSRNHAFLQFINDHIVIIDNHSTHGTFLNNVRLEPMKQYPIAINDHIRLGALELVVNVIKQ